MKLPIDKEPQDSPGFSSSHTTPAAPTPINTSFLKGETSNNATPTSATSGNKIGAAALKKGTKRNGEDSETDTKDGKKIRTNFGAARK
jgi:chromatin modification-related protein EAF6